MYIKGAYMKNYLVPILTFFLFQISTPVQSEINNHEVLMELFQSCVKEEVEGESIGKTYEYCACFVSKASAGMNMEEIMILGLDIIASGDDEKAGMQAFLSNQKVKKYVAQCIVGLYQ